MRIAFITPSLAMGGYEKVVIAYANELVNRGHKVDILCGFKKGELEKVVDTRVDIYDFQSRARKFIFPLTKYLKKNRVDILYCGFRTYSCIGVLAKWLSRSCACVYASQHGFQKDGRIECYIKGRIISRADRLIAVTKTIGNYEAAQMKIDENRFIVLNNPVWDKSISVQCESHPWFKEKRNIPVIAVCGRLARDKGKEFCVQILRLLNQYKQIRMIVLGIGPELEKVKSLAEKEGVRHLIEFLGYVDNPMGYVMNCDLLLHTALEEGFGNIIVEALAVDVPVCVTDCSGPAYIIQNEKYGINLGQVSDKHFIEEATQKVLKVLNNEIVFSNLKERALDFEVEKATDQFLNIK